MFAVATHRFLSLRSLPFFIVIRYFPPYGLQALAGGPDHRRSWENRGGAIVVEPPSFHNDPSRSETIAIGGDA
jgi:hypothetical protein